MPFDNLPPQAQMSPPAEAYAAGILARSKQVAATTRCQLDLAYGPDYWQKLDVYLPQDECRDLPVLVFLHGGGWSNGYKEWMGYMAPAFTDLPAIFVSVSYRLLPAVRFPVPLADTISALSSIHTNIRKYGGDADRLFIGGHSAGAHLAALATLRRDLLEAAGVPPAAIRACVPVAGSYRFEIGELEARGKYLLEKPEDAPQASPVSHVEGNRVPFYVTWGERDLEHVVKNGLPMVEALKRAGTRVEHKMFAGMDHFDISIDNANPKSEWVSKVREWMRTL
jgi:acetyl esterase/lipase